MEACPISVQDDIVVLSEVCGDRGLAQREPGSEPTALDEEAIGFSTAVMSLHETAEGDVQPRGLRYQELDVIANTYGLRNAEPDAGPLLSRLGEERLVDWQRMKSFVDSGVRLTGSADWPTSLLDPFKQITVMMTRITPDTDETMPPLTEAISLEEALRAYTIDAAYQLRLEDKIGSLEVGKRADLIVLDQDVFELTPDEIWNTKVVLTMMNGKTTHRDGL